MVKKNHINLKCVIDEFWQFSTLQKPPIQSRYETLHHDQKSPHVSLQAISPSTSGPTAFCHYKLLFIYINSYSMCSFMASLNSGKWFWNSSIVSGMKVVYSLLLNRILLYGYIFIFTLNLFTYGHLGRF